MTAVGLPEIATQYRPAPFADPAPAGRFLTQTRRTRRPTEYVFLSFAPGYPMAKRLLLEMVAETLNDLLGLPPDWDGDGAESVSAMASRAAIDVLESIADPDTVVPQVFPLPSGGVQLEWLIAGNDLELEFAPDGHVYALGTDALDKVVLERDAPDRLGADVRAEAKDYLRRIALPLSRER
jgi:hypothetical protein